MDVQDATPQGTPSGDAAGTRNTRTSETQDGPLPDTSSFPSDAETLGLGTDSHPLATWLPESDFDHLNSPDLSWVQGFLAPGSTELGGDCETATVAHLFDVPHVPDFASVASDAEGPPVQTDNNVSVWCIPHSLPPHHPFTLESMGPSNTPLAPHLSNTQPSSNQASSPEGLPSHESTGAVTGVCAGTGVSTGTVPMLAQDPRDSSSSKSKSAASSTSKAQITSTLPNTHGASGTLGTHSAPHSTHSYSGAGVSKPRPSSSLLPTLAAAVGTQAAPKAVRVPAESQGALDCRYESLGQALWDIGVCWEALIISNHQTQASASGTACGTASRESAESESGEDKGSTGDERSPSTAPVNGGRDSGVGGGLNSAGQLALAAVPPGNRRESGGLTGKLADALRTLRALKQRSVRESAGTGTGTGPHTHLPSHALFTSHSQQHRPAFTLRLPRGESGTRQVGQKRRERGNEGGREHWGPSEESGSAKQGMRLSRRGNVPSSSGGGGEREKWWESEVRRLLLLLALCLDKGQMTRYQELRASLATVGNPKGNATERMVHIMLTSLEMRRTGSGFSAVNTPSPYKSSVLRSAFMWYATAHPLALFLSSSNMSHVIPHILGKPKVHLLCFGYSIVSQLNIYMKLLSAPTAAPAEGSPSPSGAEEEEHEQGPGCATHKEDSPPQGPSHQHQQQDQVKGHPGCAALRRLRVTFVDVVFLQRPGRTDYKEVWEWKTVGPFLAREANALGIDFEFQVLELQESNMHCLEFVRKEPGEVVAVCDAISFQDMCDDARLAGGVLQHVMQTLRRLEPEVVTLVELEGEGAGSNFLERYECCIDWQWHLYASNDACSQLKGKKWQLIFESFYNNTNVLNLVACEGIQRAFRPRSAQSWKRIFEFWGFELVSASPSISESLDGLVASYPEGFRVRHDNGVSVITWKDFPLVFACAYQCMRKNTRKVKL